VDNIVSIIALSFSPKASIAIEIQGINLGHGNGNIILTGNLGEIAHETTLIAKTVFGMRDKSIYNFNYHLHFAYPTVKKEGPSWGLACFIMLCYLSGKLKYKNNIAATGELDLKGNVKPIRYLNEKFIAWSKSQASYLILPKSPKLPAHKDIFPVENVDEFLYLFNQN
jgi:ATP-dependent Lon protease